LIGVERSFPPLERDWRARRFERFEHCRSRWVSVGFWLAWVFGKRIGGERWAGQREKRIIGRRAIAAGGYVKLEENSVIDRVKLVAKRVSRGGLS
jgi:hypothetical protein